MENNIQGAEKMMRSNMELLPQVSVVIPVYNAEPYLRKCLDGVLKQTLQDIQVICVDDGSTDGSLAILREYEAKDSRVQVLVQKNQYAGAARNYGMTVAKGKYLVFLDSDDFFNLQMLEIMFQRCEEKKADICVCAAQNYNNVTGEVTPKLGALNNEFLPQEDVFSRKTNSKNMFRFTTPAPWNKMFRRSFIVENALLFQHTQYANDIAFTMSALAVAQTITITKKVLVSYRTNNSKSLVGKRDEAPIVFFEALSELKKRLVRFNCFSELEDAFNAFSLSSCIWSLNALKTTSAFEELFRFLKEKGFVSLGLTDYTLAYYKSCSAEGLYNKMNDILNLSVLDYTSKYGLFHNGTNDVQSSKFQNTKPQIQKSSAVAYSQTIAQLRSEGLFPKVIVSLTSYPARIKYVSKVISFVLQQSVKVDKIFIWLAKEQFPRKNASLPAELVSMLDDNIEIRWVEDLRPHKKYYYVMQEYPDCITITLDDDLYYDPYLFEDLLVSYLKYPYAVSAARAHLIRFDKAGQLLPYQEWDMENQTVYQPSMALFATSGAGALFPPHCMSEHMFNHEDIKSICLNADDVWLKVMQVISGTPVVIARKYGPLKYIEGSQDVKLWKSNIDDGGNDEQIRRVLEKYDHILGENDSLTNKMYYSFLSFSNNDKDDSVRIRKDFTPEYVIVPQNEVAELRASFSYKLGRFITWIPRKVWGLIRCYKENGLKYTYHRFWEHICGSDKSLKE